MADISQFLEPVAIGGQVQSVTGDLAAAASAAGYAAWIRSVTGTSPRVIDLGEKRVKMALTAEQSAGMQRWLDGQLSGFLRAPAEKPKVDYDLGTYLTPWALKYFVPAGVGLFVLGWIAAYYFQR